VLLSRRQWVASAALAAAPRRPNILLVMPDQLRAQSIGCMGNTDVRTPHIDRLASQGVLFSNTLANSPVCCPARAILMTGQYCHRNGMVANDLRLRESQPGIAKTLRQAGYRTGFIGKWHLDGGPRLPGFVPPGDRRHGFEYWAANECNHSHFNTHYFRDTPDPIPIRKFEAEAWTDLSLEFLRDSKKDGRPFFLSVFMGPPHDPYGAPDSYMKMYDPARLTMRPNWKAVDKAPRPKDIAAYYAATTAVDDQVGRLIAALDDSGMAEDTIVLFTSDHGDMLGSQGLRLKRKPWEESIRIPGILRYPRRYKPRTEEALFSHIDMPPTLLSLCGLAAAPKAPRSVYFQIFGPYEGDATPAGWRGVRTGRYMYATFRDKPWVLYDLRKDPYQMENLAADPAAASIRRNLETELAGWMKSTGDSWDKDWTYPVEDGDRLFNDKTYYSVPEYLATLNR
jgi:arylsulfatase A-like enzyme